ncbi:MAG: hypothetical protein F6K16_27780 [Symploca sp. SIO2B6]|nr:hypothetical protein [Symploca sp. SIO2B6]
MTTQAKSSDTGKVNGILEWTSTAVDAGNRTIASCNGDGILLNMPSVHAELNPFDDPPGNVKDSAVIHYYSGKAAARNTRYVVGGLAHELGGIQTFTEDKADLAGKLVLGAIQLPPSQRQAVIRRLILCTPNTIADTKIAAMKEQLLGIHSYERNGVGLTVDIRSVVCQPETQGAYFFAQANNLFKWSEHPNGILDLGGKTSIGQVYLPSGMAPKAGRIVLPGTYKLAQMVADNDSNLAQLDNTPDLGLIMDGIASQQCMYGLDICFRETFEQQLPKWLGEIRSQVKLAWGKYLSQLGEVLMIGGSAPLANSFVVATGGRYKIADNHSTINVEGMALHG